MKKKWMKMMMLMLVIPVAFVMVGCGKDNGGGGGGGDESSNIKTLGEYYEYAEGYIELVQGSGVSGASFVKDVNIPVIEDYNFKVGFLLPSYSLTDEGILVVDGDKTSVIGTVIENEDLYEDAGAWSREQYSVGNDVYSRSSDGTDGVLPGAVWHKWTDFGLITGTVELLIQIINPEYYEMEEGEDENIYTMKSSALVLFSGDASTVTGVTIVINDEVLTLTVEGFDYLDESETEQIAFEQIWTYTIGGQTVTLPQSLLDAIENDEVLEEEE